MSLDFLRVFNHFAAATFADRGWNDEEGFQLDCRKAQFRKRVEVNN